jgi:lipopolysaccharide export system permease protein
MVSDTRDPATELIYYAQTGVVTEIDGNDVVVMTNGQIHRENVKDGSVSVIRFNSYAISLSQFGSTATSASYYPPMEHETIELLNPDPESFYAKKSPDWLRTEFHRRMTDWLHPILYGLIALVVAGQTRSHRQNSFNTFFLAVGATLLYKGAAYAAYGVARHDSGLAWMLYAIPLGGIVLSAGMYLNGITVAAPDWIGRGATELFEAVRRFRIRHARARTT